MHKLNRIKDDRSKPCTMYRSFSTMHTAANVPAVLDLRPAMPPVFDQGQVGSCTGNAWCGLLEYIELMELRKNLTGPEQFDKIYHHMSRLFLYYNERIIEGDTDIDGGAQIQTGGIAVSKYGICRAALWPYIDANALIPPIAPAYAEASHHLIKNPLRIEDGDISAMKSCLLQGYPFVFGIQVYESFESEEAATTGVIPMPGPNESIQGGHAICCVGFDDINQVFICRNSWGPNWGDKGYFYLPYAFVKDTTYSSDFWTLRP